MDTLNITHKENEIVSKKQSSKNKDIIKNTKPNSSEARVDLIEEKMGVSLESVKSPKITPAMVKGNIENFFGAIEIPLGLAGPLLFKENNEEIYTPVGTSEGALVASMCRGAKAISVSGGVKTHVTRSLMTRCPFFQCEDLEQSIQVFNWFKSHLSSLREKSKDYSNYIQLLDVVPKYGPRGVGVRFEYKTGDASGQNMSTVCTWNLCQWASGKIKEELSLDKLEFLIDGGWSSDKKASYTSAIEGRGKEVFAEAVIKKEVAEKMLKADVIGYVKSLNQCRAHSSFMGGMGFHLNVSNVMAGIFAATGQDLACINECSTANFYVEETDEGDLYISLHIPNLLVGTVGGGVSLPGPKSMLELMDCYGPNKVERLTKIIAGYALALELSTSTAIYNGSFAQAHDRLGRNRTVNWLKFGEINKDFFSLHGEFEDDFIEIERDKEFSTDKSLISELVSPVTKRVSGIFKYNLIGGDDLQNNEVILKVKPMDEEVNLAFLILAGLEDMKLKETLLEYKPHSLFKNCHIKEQMIYKEYSEKFNHLFPKSFGTIIDPKREIFLLFNEYLKDYKFIDLSNSKFFKNESYIKDVISAITPFHAHNYDRQDYQEKWLNKPMTFNDMIEMKQVWKKLISFAHNNFKSIVNDNLFKAHNSVIDEIEEWSKKANSLKATLIHCDFNPRNIGYRSSDGSVKVIDWELAQVGLPHRDIVELLAYTTDDEFSLEEFSEVINFHKKEFEFCLQEKVNHQDWVDSYRCALNEFIIHRLPLYFVAHAHKECEFLPALYKQSHHLLSLMEKL